jgi:two-component system, NarL family, invasion response regulator UvrY
VIRILLIDDHPVVRRGIRQILIDGMERVTVGEAADGPQALASIKTGDWEIVVLDLSLPGVSGLDLLKEIRRINPTLPVLVLSMHPAAQFARRVMAAGASGYLNKDSAPTELIAAIQQLRQGQPYHGRGLAADPAGQPAAAGRPHDLLSDREYQVLRMLGSGRTVSEIASALALSVKTISTYRTRLLMKLQMHGNAELMRYAIENGLADP